MQQDVLNLLRARKGHFLLESGHHGDLWLDLEALYLRPAIVQPLTMELARRLEPLSIDAICAPLVEGAFVGLMVANHLNLEFTYTEPFSRPSRDGLFQVGYRVPGPLRNELRGKRVAIVNDVVNAGSAVRGTFADLQHCEANVVAIGTLLVLGNAAFEFAGRMNVAIESLAKLPNLLWTTDECPLCAEGVPLDR